MLLFKKITVNHELCEFSSVTTCFQRKCAKKYPQSIVRIVLFFQVVYTLYTRYQTPKMWCQDAADIQKATRINIWAIEELPTEGVCEGCSAAFCGKNAAKVFLDITNNIRSHQRYNHHLYFMHEIRTALFLFVSGTSTV